MCCISNEISVYVQSSGGHIGFKMGNLPSLLITIFRHKPLCFWFCPTFFSIPLVNKSTSGIVTYIRVK